MMFHVLIYWANLSSLGAENNLYSILLYSVRCFFDIRDEWCLMNYASGINSLSYIHLMKLIVFVCYYLCWITVGWWWQWYHTVPSYRNLQPSRLTVKYFIRVCHRWLQPNSLGDHLEREPSIYFQTSFTEACFVAVIDLLCCFAFGSYEA